MFCPAISGAEPWMGSYRPSLPPERLAEAIEAAVAKVLETYRTPDIYEEGLQKVSCEEMGDLVCAQL